MMLFEDLEGEAPPAWLDQVAARVEVVESKIVKLRPLCERGADGERENARRATEKLEAELRDLRGLYTIVLLMVSFGARGLP